MARRSALWSRKRFFQASGPMAATAWQEEIALRSALIWPISPGDGREGDLSLPQRAPRWRMNTRTHPRTRARGLAGRCWAIYELSRRPHREVSSLADRFGPMRISPLHRGHRQ